MGRRTLVACLALLASACGQADREATVAPQPTGPPLAGGFRLERVADGFDEPIQVVALPDRALLVLEQAGRIWRIEPTGRRSLAGDLRRQTRAGGERGLLNLALAPDFVRTGRLVLDYTDRDGNTRIVETRMSNETIRTESGRELLRIDQPYANHNGGGLAFGPDGYLYIGMGDGGSGGDPEDRAQDPDELLGKILRIDIDRPGAGRPYGIPPDNPFAAGGGRPEIWALGVRNPWRLAFDSATGDLWFGDVGQNAWEEIDHVRGAGPPGANYGWPIAEGPARYRKDGRLPPDVIPPVAAYDHDAGCSVTGGVVAEDPTVAPLRRHYLYGDYCSGRVWALLAVDGAEPSEITPHLGGPRKDLASFAYDADGRVVLVQRSGEITRIVPDP